MKRTNRWFWLGMMFLLVAMLAIGCSSSGGGSHHDDDDDETPGEPAAITLAAGATAVAINGTMTVTATVKDKNGNNVADGTTVSLTEVEKTGELAGDYVNITPGSQETSGGTATFVITGILAGTVELIAESGAAIATINITVVDTAPQITVTASAITLAVGETATISATVRESDGSLVPNNTTVNFALSDSTIADLSATSAKTTSGVATVTFTAKKEGTVEVSATYGAGRGSISMTVGNPSTNPPATITLSSSAATVMMGQTATITASVRDSSGTAVANGTVVNFSTDSGTVNPGGGSTTGGTATTTFTGTQIGEATITATSGSATDTITVTVTADIEFMSISTNKTSIKTDNEDSATITVTLLDADRVPVEGAPVTFAASGGQMSASQVDSDANGEAVIVFKSGAYDKRNQVVNIEAEAPPDMDASIPIQLTGTKVSLSIGNTSLQGLPTPSETTLTVTVKDGGGVAVFGADVTINQDSTGSGSVLFREQGAAGTGAASMTATTDVTGKLLVTVRGNNAGLEPVTISAEALGAENSVDVVVSGLPFEFVKEDLPLNPGTYISEDEVISASTGSVIDLYVRSPDGNNVQISTTMGTLDVVAPTLEVSGGGTAVLVATPDSTIAHIQLTTPTSVGVATLLAEDTTDTSINDTLKIAIAAPASEAEKVSIQASPTVVAVSSGSLINISTLNIEVTNDEDEVVGGAPVVLTLEDATGGGEYISPSLVYTDAYGQAEATFYAGSLVSDSESVKCVATLLVFAATDDVSIVIGGDASSVAIGAPTEFEAYSESMYRKPMTVLVADSNGNAVAGATVNLSVWPLEYRTGCVGDEPVYCFAYPNEDGNRNEVLDAGEDIGANPAHGNGVLDPAKSTAGTVPPTVITDEYGVAEFDYFQQKIYSTWTKVEISASVVVYGTETKAILRYGPNWLEADEPYLPDSPWGCEDCPAGVCGM